MIWLLAVLVLAGASVNAHAKIGETREQLISRYGEVVREENKEKERGGYVLFFLFEDYEVEVTVVSQTINDDKFTNTAEAIGFRKKDGTTIEEAEINALMGQYGERSQWVDQDLGRPAAMRSRDKKEFYLKNDQKNQGLMCFIETAQPYGISFISEKYYGAIIQAGVKNMSIPMFGK